MNALGICIGSSSLTFSCLDGSSDNFKVVATESVPHGGNPMRVLTEKLARFSPLENYFVAVTGRKFRHLLNLPSISEPEAVELAASHVLKGEHACRTLISAGGETFLVYRLGPEGKVEEIRTGNKCASGTGEFLLQQLGRIGLKVTDLENMDVSSHPHKVSGRCSVFCKSDCTHALNKGVPKSEVVSGLGRMMAGKCIELLKKFPKSKVALVGGCARNRFMLHYLEEGLGEKVLIPDYAVCFEALGAAIYALRQAKKPVCGAEGYFRKQQSSFSLHPPLANAASMVDFKTVGRGTAKEDDEVIVGLDVGSTTTKGIVLRRADKQMLASRYLRTEGDPITASRQVYASLAEQLGNVRVKIVALGVTGSGRAIAGLHGKTKGVVNEIIAHATAAVHFDPEVDTIFEIGGQDAKYTFLENGVPCDYAMNEACSAGTGSFLEESAKESLGIAMTEIADLALEGKNPPNFNDQCAAFISSDIALAGQEGLGRQDIVAGLVYSICLNYVNRVKGNRPTGRKIFMQGGVCYNRAVPIAMAALTGKHIVVPPEPGLMGAFGVALAVDERLQNGELEKAEFDLRELALREVTRCEPFICPGGKEKCDQGCEVSRIKVEGKVYPFGGICGRYDGQRRTSDIDETEIFNAVVDRERAVDLMPKDPEGASKSVGITGSFLNNTYFPMFSTFFSELGFKVLRPKSPDPTGFNFQGAAFCFPGELAHGYMASLLAASPDYIFLPHVRALPKDNAKDHKKSCSCVLVQGEPYYLRTAFARYDLNDKIISPVIDFSGGLHAAKDEFIKTGVALGADTESAGRAFDTAEERQRMFQASLKELGRKFLAKVSGQEDKFGIVIFGRPYNAFSSFANKGVPAKFASRGFAVAPFDALDFESSELDPGLNMYWGMGRGILKAAKLVAANPRLFGVYISNFSCGPDSFLVTHFREIMGEKPSLTLELDSHTADAGLDTRIEAFLDIASYHFKGLVQTQKGRSKSAATPAKIEKRGKEMGVVGSDGAFYPFNHERVRFVVPSISRFTPPIIAKAFESGGLRGIGLEPSKEVELKRGRGVSSCKECLPLQLTAGALLSYQNSRPKDEVTVYLMPSAGGPCRFGQYEVFIRKLIEREGIADTAVFSPTALDGYQGFSHKITLSLWRGLIISDLFEEMHSTLLAGAKFKNEALEIFNAEYKAVCETAGASWSVLSRQLRRSAARLAQIELVKPYAELPKVSLLGEIYVRHDPISRQRIVERLAEKGFVVRTSPMSEWAKYIDWLVKNGNEDPPNFTFWVHHFVKTYVDSRVRRALAPSGLFYDHTLPVRELVKAGKRYISAKLTGEAILTVGSAFSEMLHPSCGVVSLGPFGCMPSRVAEAILCEKFTSDELAKVWPEALDKLGPRYRLPFLALETDGNPFPQIIEAKIEAFCLQAARLHEKIQKLS